ncbi:MAG: methyltransferase [Planctomycetota bacterium]
MTAPPIDRQRILELMSGFRPACVIGAAAELDLWSQLSEMDLTADEMALRLGGDLRAVTMLLDAVAAIGLLNKHNQRYGVPKDLRPLLFEDSPESLLPMLRHGMSILRGWSNLAWTALAGIPAPKVSSIRGPAADRAAFVAAMHVVSGPVADELVQRLGPPKFKHLLDVGGASGTWTLAFLAAVPNSRATIFDLPDAIGQAKERLARDEFADRVTLAAGDFYVDPLPSGADYAWVSAIAHQHSRQHNRELFEKVFRALEPGGRIAIRDIVMEPSRTEPVDGALFAINMLVNTATGGTFTFDEFAEDLKAAGFENPELKVKDPGMNAVIEAAKPE